jgi:toxin ParE1/3/4
MSRQLTVASQARDELRDAIAWYERQKPGLGQEFLGEVRACLHRIHEQPSVGSRLPGMEAVEGVRRLLMERFPYALVYREGGNEVRVLAVAHTRRRPGYWWRR